MGPITDDVGEARTVGNAFPAPHHRPSSIDYQSHALRFVAIAPFLGDLRPSC